LKEAFFLNKHIYLLLFIIALAVTLSACVNSPKQETGAPASSSLPDAVSTTHAEATENASAASEPDSSIVATTEAESEPITEPATEPITEPNEEPETDAGEEPGSETTAEPFVYHGLVELLAFDDSFIIEQKYATTDNFTGVQQYDRELCLVNRDIVDMLITANRLARENGVQLKIWDAYRPISVQQALHDSVPEELAAYVPAPGPYSMHARGISVDVTLCDKYGNQLYMPTKFDDFSEAAHYDYDDLKDDQIQNRDMLNSIMTAAGFQQSELEWWHFDGPNRDDYEILDISFAEFEAARDGNR
jgi:D-alanyl-D-alanine dipeptidase